MRYRSKYPSALCTLTGLLLWPTLLLAAFPKGLESRIDIPDASKASEETRARLGSLESAAKLFVKSPRHDEKFYALIGAALKDEDPVVAKNALYYALKAETIQAYDVLNNFKIEVDRQNWRGGKHPTGTLFETYKLVQFMLLEIDFQGAWKVSQGGGTRSCRFDSRDELEQIRFLRATYWSSTAGMVNGREVVDWVVRKLARYSMDQARDALLAIQKEELASLSPNHVSGIPDLLKRALHFQSYFSKADSVEKAMAEVLKDEDSRIVRWGVDVLKKLEQKAAVPVLTAAMKYHRDAFENDKKGFHAEARDVIVKGLYDLGQKVDLADLNWGPPSL